MVDSLPGRHVGLIGVTVARSEVDSDPAVRLAVIGAKVEEWLDLHRPDAVAVERVFAQHNVRTVMGTAQVSGVVMAAAARRGIPVALHTPSEVKAAVTGNGRADKAQVTSMVTRILGLSEAPRPADAADALALAICHLWRPTTPGAAMPGVEVVGAASAGSSATPAQRAWAQAEQAARRSHR